MNTPETKEAVLAAIRAGRNWRIIAIITAIVASLGLVSSVYFYVTIESLSAGRRADIRYGIQYNCRTNEDLKRVIRGVVRDGDKRQQKLQIPGYTAKEKAKAHQTSLETLKKFGPKDCNEVVHPKGE